MKRTKVWVLCLVAMMVLSPLIGLTAQASGDIKTIRMYIGDTNASPVDLFETPIGKKITELTGFRAEIEYIVGNDESTKAGVMIASGDYPDIINGHEVHRAFLEASALIPMEDLIAQYGENTKKYYDEKRLKKLMLEDGHTYFLSGYIDSTELVYAVGGTQLQVAVLEDAGWPVVKDFDQYVDLIRAYVKKYPTINGKPTIGFTQCTDQWRWFTVASAPARLAGHPNDATAIVDPVTFEAKKFFTTPEAQRYCKTLNEMWNEGLLDPEMFAQDYDTYISKISEGRVLGFLEPLWQIQSAELSLKSQGMYDRMHVAVPATFDGVEDSYQIPSYMVVRDGNSISVNCKDPVMAFQFLDAMLREDVLRLMFWGIEGEDYSVVDGKYVRTPEQWARAQDPEYVRKQGLRGAAGTWAGFATPPQHATFSDGNLINPFDTQEFIDLAYNEHDYKVLNAYGVKSYPELLAPAKFMPWGEAWDIALPQDNYAVQDSSVLGNLQREYVPKLVMCKSEEFDGIWAEYAAEIEKHRDIITELERLITEGIKFRVENWN